MEKRVEGCTASDIIQLIHALSAMQRRASMKFFLCALVGIGSIWAQPGGGGRGPQVVSPEVLADHRVTFRILAPNAQAVTLNAGDIQASAWASASANASAPANPVGGRGGRPLTKGENGVWELTTSDPVVPGAYRYVFNVDGVTTMDPRDTSISESNAQNWSLFFVPGAGFMETKDVPHGAVASVTYYSKTLDKFRRMHIYTPPGYETSSRKFPIFYLLHGAGDCDESWTSVGRAAFILDNLIAEGKAKPMVVVMPAGHTTQTMNLGGRGAGAASGRPLFDDDFVNDFMNEIMPYAESHYRIQADRAHRAIAGLSMGGGHTLYIAIPHLDKFAYIGVFSSGLFGIAGGSPGRAGTPPPEGPNPVTAWEEQNKANLDNPVLKKELKLFWFSTGMDDGLIATSKATVEFLKRHGFNATFEESPGAHTWINWRNYLDEFACKLFN
jgi:enterochelin esterase-like enzyme